MSDFRYSYVYFDTQNFTGAYSTTGYALSVCPFTFLPRVQNSLDFSNKRILWDFGDGTTSSAVTATHAYNLPGSYTVTMYLYNSGGDAFYNSFDAQVTVYNYINDSIVLSASNLNFIVSDIDSNEFLVYRFNSWQNVVGAPDTILLYVSGNNAPYIDEQQFNKDKYGHLKKYSQFYQLQFNTGLQIFEYAPTNNVTTTSEKLYARLSDTKQVIPCASTDIGSVFAGTSGYAQCAYKDDLPTSTHPTLIFASFNNIEFKDPNTANVDIPITTRQMVGTRAQSFYCTLSVLQPNQIFISSTGVSAMKLNAVQFANARIPFVVQAANGADAPCKYLSNLKRVDAAGALSANTIKIYAIDATTQQTLTSAIVDDFGEFQNYNTGIYKGYCSFSAPLTGVKLVAVASVSGSCGTYQLSATTDDIEIVADDLALFKINENYDQAAKYKSYRFQETLLDKEVFFDSFLGTVVGNISAGADALGKRIHEKQANFVDNTQFVDACNIDGLYALKDMLNANISQFDRYNFGLPAELQRAMNIISIKHSKLWGVTNEYNENFDNRGYLNSSTYGFNLGERLDALTTILTAGSAAGTIVAYERFSGNYKLINTDILSSTHINFIDAAKQTYALSAYNNFWGWGLVLPLTFDATTFDQYYYFYKHIPTPAGDILNSIINWSDPLTTISRTQSSYNTWSTSNGLMEKLIQQALYNGLALFTNVSGQSAAYIPPSLQTLLQLDEMLTTLSLDDCSTELSLDN